jgi:hypothetical protein
MKLPDKESAVVAKRKVVEYLLSSTHEDGRSKADFFRRFGFRLDRWQELATALKLHAVTHAVSKIVSTDYGVRYIIVGELETPDGRRPMVRSVWFIEKDGPPKLVTAYPVKTK